MKYVYCSSESLLSLILGPKEIPRSNVRLTRELGTCVYGPIWDAEVILKPGFTSRCLIKVCNVHTCHLIAAIPSPCEVLNYECLLYYGQVLAENASNRELTEQFMKEANQLK